MTLRRAYGASPLHLIAHALGLAAAGWAVLQILEVRGAFSTLVWVVGAVLLHDALLWPLYSLADRVVVPRVSSMAFRVPLGLSLLLGLVWLPQITQVSEGSHRYLAGTTFEGAAEHWLLASAALFLVSGVVALARSGADPASARRAEGPASAPPPAP